MCNLSQSPFQKSEAVQVLSKPCIQGLVDLPLIREALSIRQPGLHFRSQSLHIAVRFHQLGVCRQRVFHRRFGVCAHDQDRPLIDTDCVEPHVTPGAFMH